MGDVMDYYVEVVKFGSDEIVRKLGPFTERKAEKVDIGLNINLNHEEFYTRFASK